MQQRQHAGVGSNKRVPVNTPATAELVGIASDYHLPGVNWDYYNTVTQLLNYTVEWPEGFAAHFAWQGEGQWRVINLWRNAELLERFFGEVAIHSISQAISLLGAVPNRDGATDVEPEHHAVERLILGPRSRAFAAIGADRDGEAIGALGGEPVAIELDVSEMDANAYAKLVLKLGYADAVPAELISHHAMPEDDGMRIFEVWSGSGHALATLGSELLPAIERLGIEQGRDYMCVHQEHRMRRIAVRPEVVTAFGF
jgi:hypothetical protein